MGDTKIQSQPNAAVVQAQKAVDQLDAKAKEMDGKLKTAGFEANRVDLANKDKAAHGDAAAKKAIDDSQKKREAAQKEVRQAQKELKDAQVRLEALKNGQKPQVKAPAPKNDPVKAKDQKTPPKPVQAPVQEMFLKKTRVYEFESRTFNSEMLISSIKELDQSMIPRTLNGGHTISPVKVPTCAPSPQAKGAGDPKKPKDTQPEQDLLVSGARFFCGAKPNSSPRDKAQKIEITN